MMTELLSRLNLMDCMDGMKQFPDKYFDLAIVDPPYGISRFDGGKKSWINKYGRTDCVNSWVPSDEYFDLLFRISKNQIIFGGNYFNLPLTSSWIVWDKARNGGSNGNYGDGELIWSSFSRVLKIKKLAYDGFVGRDRDGRIHPTQKPVLLYRWILQNYANKGDLILDTHVGSGSSIIACIEEGFEYCGFEIDKGYYDASCKRIEEVKAQGKLFYE